MQKLPVSQETKMNKGQPKYPDSIYVTCMDSSFAGSVVVPLDTAKESQIENRIAWLSLDDGDNDPTRFLAYFIDALNQAKGIETTLGEDILGMLQSPQPPLIGNGQARGRFVPIGMFHYPRGDNNERGRYPISKSKE